MTITVLQAIRTTVFQDVELGSGIGVPELAPADTVELLPPEEPPPIRPGLPRGLEPS